MAIIDTFREKWANILWGGFALLVISASLAANTQSQLLSNILYGGALIAALLAVIRSSYIGCIIYRGEEAQGKSASASRKTENVVFASVAWVLVSCSLMVIASIMLVAGSTRTGTKIVWSILAVAFLCQLLSVAYGSLKRKKS